LNGDYTSMRERKNVYIFWSKTLKRRTIVNDLVVKGKIILK
jgi:ribosomal 50S subunit-recycling heat shock protein